MTCIVGLEFEGGVIIGGDSAATVEGRVQLTTAPKVFKLTTDPGKGDPSFALLIGYTWSFRMGQIIQYSAEYAPRIILPKSNYEYLVNSFIPFLRDIFKDAGWLKTADSRDEGGQFLIGIRGQLYEINSDFSVLRMKNGYDAIGSGTAYALGALYVIEKVNEFSDVVEPPTYIVDLALQAAAYYSTSVSAPFMIRKIHNDE